MINKIKIIFYNFFSIGDTHFAQPFVKNIIDNNGDKFEYCILSNFNFYIYTSILPDIKIIQNDILKDLNVNLSSENLKWYDYYFFKEQNILFINTWIGNYLYILSSRKDYFLTYYKESVIECDPVSYIKSYQIMLNIILEKENIKINYNNDPLISIPVFPPNLDIEDFLNFKKNNSNKKIVFINNYYPCSGQKISIHNVEDRICLIDYFIKKNYIVLLSEYENDLQVYKIENNITNLYFTNVLFKIDINYSCYNIYFCAKVAHNCDVALYFDTGRNFTYINQEFIDEYKNNINRNTKIHFGIDDKFFKPLSNKIYFPDGYVKFIQAENCHSIIKKLETCDYF